LGVAFIASLVLDETLYISGVPETYARSFIPDKPPALAQWAQH
jgi:hypothetical protein